MAASIRMNPLHAPMTKPLGTPGAGGSNLPQINHVAGQVEGPMFGHLGHFASGSVLRAGHNTNGRMSIRRGRKPQYKGKKR